MPDNNIRIFHKKFLLLFQSVMPVYIYDEETAVNPRRRWVIIGDSRLSEAYRYDPDLPHPRICWAVYPGADHRRLLGLFRELLREATTDTTFVLHIWQNSLRTLTDMEAREAIDHTITIVNARNVSHRFDHRLVWPETDLPPELRHIHGRIRQLNLVLRLANHQCGFIPCQPNPITSPIRCRRGRATQGITPSRWREAVAGTGPGYHVSSEFLAPYLRYFRRYLRFNDTA